MSIHKSKFVINEIKFKHTASTNSIQNVDFGHHIHSVEEKQLATRAKQSVMLNEIKMIDTII